MAAYEMTPEEAREMRLALNDLQVAQDRIDACNAACEVVASKAKARLGLPENAMLFGKVKAREWHTDGRVAAPPPTGTLISMPSVVPEAPHAKAKK